MLAPADADVVRRDPALPGLATLLDPDAFAEVVRPRVRPESARITYVRYKPGTSCVVGYRLTTAAGSVDAAGTAYRPTAGDKLAKAGGRPGRLVLCDRAVVVSFFPDDDALDGLPRVADPADRPVLLGKLFPGRPDLWGGTVETVRYKPGRRYVGRLTVGGAPRAALKVYTPSAYEAAHTRAKAFRSCPGFRRPSRLGRSARHGILATEWLAGRPLNEALADPGFDVESVAGVGAALAALHGQDAPGLLRPPADDPPRSLAELTAWVGHVCPTLAGRARDLARGLADRLADRYPADRPLHGDFHAQQVLLGGPVCLLDFDEAHRGDPALDLGLFLAHLERDVVRGNVPADRAGRARAALLAGYGATAPAPGDVALFTALGLLRLAPHVFRHREPDWPRRTTDLLDRAEDELRAVAVITVPVAAEVPG